MSKILFFVIWLVSILASIAWTYENPEKIKILKNILKYDLSLRKFYKDFKSKKINNRQILKNQIRSIEIDTAYNHIILDHYTVPVYSSYGGIDQFANDILYLSGDGDLFLLQEKKINSFEFKKTFAAKINNKKDIFVQNNEKKVGNYAERFFGIKDILVDSFEGFENKLLFASSLEYNESKDCYTVGVYLSKIKDSEIFEISEWRNIFSTNKCLTINLTKNPRFAAASAGGRIIKFDENHILLSIGDFYADGVNGPALSQDFSNMYGKMIKINFKKLNYEIYSFGHRNPQGLYIDKDNNIFSTEHGPTYGDELNYISQNNNYGWPLATYGTSYVSVDAYTKKKVDESEKIWPLDITANTHNSFTKPLFSWGNTVGISNLIVYENDYFSRWNKNLIISTLASNQLIRMNFDYKKQSIIYKENIKIGQRIRDIIEMDDGRIVLLTDRGKKFGENPEIIIISNKDN